MIVMLLILFLAITTQSSVVHYNLSNNDYSIKLLCMKCILFCKFIGGETAHHRCLVQHAVSVNKTEILDNFEFISVINCFTDL